jgi:hypothetical protein
MTYYAHPRNASNKPSRRLRTWAILSVAIGGLLMPFVGPSFAKALDGAATPLMTPALIINEVQTSGCSTSAPCTEDTKMEFVELYNTQNMPLQVSGWKLRYISASGGTTNDLASFNGQVAAHGYVLIAHAGYYPEADLFFGTATSAGMLAKTGGHVELVNSSDTVVDKVGWGTAAQAQTKPVSAMLPGQSAERGTDPGGLPLYSANNFNDFTAQTIPTSQAGNYTVSSISETASPEPTPTPASTPTPVPVITQPNGQEVTLPADGNAMTPPIIPTCNGVVISELLPNPAGSDTGHEFIELHNPTDETIALDGCSMQTSASTTKTFAFSQSRLQPGEYHSFSDSVTGLTLPNSAGGTVWLTDAAVELQALTYPGAMDDDTTWNLVDNVWSASFTPTPGAANVATPLKPCDDGEVRNPDTNRCVSNTATAASSNTSSPSSTDVSVANTTPAACKAGQERNPATNRCRAIASTAANATVACKAGQERNPETNRCRNVATAASAAKACPTGQERNAETNRCRKITAAGSSNGSDLNGVKDIATTAGTKSKPYWLIAALAIAVAVAYGVYEWRQEIKQFIGKMSGKQPRTLTSAVRL